MPHPVSGFDRSSRGIEEVCFPSYLIVMQKTLVQWSTLLILVARVTSLTSSDQSRPDRAGRTLLSKSLPQRTSAAKAVKRVGSLRHGTAEAVPFVRHSLPQPLRLSEG